MAGLLALGVVGLLLAVGVPVAAPASHVPPVALGHSHRSSAPSSASEVWGQGLSARKTLLRPELPLLNWVPHLRAAVSGYQVPIPARTSPAHWAKAPQSPGQDLILSGTQTVVISRNLTVRNINLSGNATLIVRNLTTPVVLTVEGNIVLQGSAIFYLNQSSLVVDEHYDNELSITGSGNSLYLVYGANVSANGFQWIGSFGGNANMTVIGSYYCFPGSWFPEYAGGNATIYVAGSYFLADLVMQDSILQPSTAHVTVHQAVGFNLWIGLRQNAAVNVSFPAPLSFQSWQFPGPFAVSNVNYSVDVTGSYVGYHVVSVWPGSNVTIAHTAGVVVALNPFEQNLTLGGLREGWLNYSYAQSGFAVHLLDTEVVSWNLYAFSSNVTVSGAEIGGIIASTGSSVVVEQSWLTGSGGYYGALQNASLRIYNSTITGQVTGYQNANLLLQNCTVRAPFPQQITATAHSTILARNTILGPNATFGARDQGRVVASDDLTVRTLGSGGGLAGAQVTVDWTGNSTPAARGTTDGTGLVRFTLLSRIVLPSANVSLANYTVLALHDWDGGSAPIDLTAPTSVAVEPVPLVVSTLPQNGSTDVPATTNATIQFGVPMNASLTDRAIVTVPRTPFVPQWSPAGTELTLAFDALAWNVSYSIVIGNGATTAAGLPFPDAYVSSFTTASRPSLVLPPVVAQSYPLNSSASLSPWTNATITFSRPMDAASTLAAIGLNPVVPGERVTLNGATLTWTHPLPLAYGTRYTLTVSTHALDNRGVPLSHPFVLVFATESGNPLTPAHGTSVFPTSLVIGLVAASVVLGSLVLLLANAVLRRRPPTLPELPSLAAIPVLPPPWKED